MYIWCVEYLSQHGKLCKKAELPDVEVIFHIGIIRKAADQPCIPRIFYWFIYGIIHELYILCLEAFQPIECVGYWIFLEPGQAREYQYHRKVLKIRTQKIWL